MLVYLVVLIRKFLAKILLLCDQIVLSQYFFYIPGSEWIKETQYTEVSYYKNTSRSIWKEILNYV